MRLRSRVKFAAQQVARPTRGRVNAFGRGVIGLIDVGSVGRLPEPWDTHAPKIRRLLKFEPRDNAAVRRDTITRDEALWSAPGPREFFVYKGGAGAGSSLFRQNVAYVRQHYDDLRVHGPRELADTWFERSELDHIETVQCTTLDSVLAEHPGPFHVLKIDTQGAESEILNGARGYLAGDCLALHLELFNIPLYEGIALRRDVTVMLEDAGFEQALEYPPHGSFNSQNDVVFFRRGAAGPEMNTITSVYGL